MRVSMRHLHWPAGAGLVVLLSFCLELNYHLLPQNRGELLRENVIRFREVVRSESGF